MSGNQNAESEESQAAADMDMCNSPVDSEDSGPDFRILARPLPAIQQHWMINPPQIPPDPAAGPTALPAQMILMMNPHNVGYGTMAYMPTRNPLLPPGLPLGGQMDKEQQPCSSGHALGSLQKEQIKLSEASMYPPNPKAPPPQTRERPPGCRTIYVGGLPEKCKEEILAELFGRCGEIQSIRMSKKNFAHIRFLAPESVDKSLYFSGFRMKIEDRSDKEYSGKLHVDFAHARDDQYEYECSQRALMRQQRHCNRSESTSPSPVSQYSEPEASVLLEKLKASESFTPALEVVISWLDHGDCNKRSSAHFYSMIGAVNAHLRRLINEKQTHDAELSAAKESHKERVQTIMNQFGLIEKALVVARKQRNWDHFTKAQRKHLEQWLKQAEETRRNQENDLLRDRQEDPMETSEDDEEDESSPSKKLKFDPVPFYQQQIQRLQEEIKELKSKGPGENVDGSQSEEREAVDEEWKERVGNLEIELSDAKKSRDSLSLEVAELKKQLGESSSSSNPHRQAKMIALISSFLLVHPTGASIDYIWSYLDRGSLNGVKTSEIESVLELFPDLFRQNCSGVGASLERKWLYIGLISKE